MNNKLVVGLVVLVLAAGGYWFTSRQSNAPAESPSPSESPLPSASHMMDDGNMMNGDGNMPGSSMMASPGMMQGMVKSFTVESVPFSFSVKEIRVKNGDTVKLTLNNKKGMHDWRVDEFNAATKVLKDGESDTIEFKADKAGTFEFYCSVGSHRAMGMVGKLIVE